jgi:hypothetical protein
MAFEMDHPSMTVIEPPRPLELTGRTMSESQRARHVRLWEWHNWPAGRWVVGAVPLVCLGMLAVSFCGARDVDPHASYLQRARIADKLRQDGNLHLVMVRYGSGSIHDGWVYNDADIDAAPIVWAHEMDAEHNQRLLAYFKDRRVWLVDTGRNPDAAVPYPHEPDQTGMSLSR